MAPPVHISWIPLCRHMTRTCSIHMAYSLIWSVTNKGMRYGTPFAQFCRFAKNGQRGYPSGTPMVPPVHISSIPVCRYMTRTCSLHMTHSLIWSVTNKGLHCCSAFGEISIQVHSLGVSLDLSVLVHLCTIFPLGPVVQLSLYLLWTFCIHALRKRIYFTSRV